MKESFPTNGGLTPDEEFEVAAAKAEMTEGGFDRNAEWAKANAQLDEMLAEVVVDTVNEDGEAIPEDFIEGLKLWRLLKGFEGSDVHNGMRFVAEAAASRYGILTREQMSQRQFEDFNIFLIKDKMKQAMEKAGIGG
jgi:hypothetical protein